MQSYANLHGSSGVESFDSGPDFIRLCFRDSPRWVYVYDYVVPGAAHLERMKAPAAEGRGLSTYISQQVREEYRRKEPLLVSS
jgi:hypothetical protein